MRIISVLVALTLPRLLVAEVVPCGDSSAPADYPFEVDQLATDWYCEETQATTAMGTILSGLAAQTSPDSCSECDPPQIGCSRSGHTIPGPGATSCGGDDKEHRLVVDMPAPKYTISCSECS